MNLITQLKSEAERRQLIEPQTEIDPATTFRLVRDMPYVRASSRKPETIIKEWRGTCSGKHYLLQALFAELGIASDLIACTVTLQLDLCTLPPVLAEVLAPTNGRFVDVHNYLRLKLPEGEMIVDATWPLASKALGMTVNETFTLGQDQQIVYPPTETWVMPPDQDPQTFKEALLQAHFTPQELGVRDAFIETISRLLFT
jgi:hypothetical protein